MLLIPGFGSGVNLPGLELGSMASGPGGLKEVGGQQSRFKWMMEGHSPAPPSPDDALHKNGGFFFQCSMQLTSRGFRM